ncbi:MAG: TonB-dependent receptor [Halioglobus sp.]|nr:TonB-dependent receptor [Halioglobus sp.]
MKRSLILSCRVPAISLAATLGWPGAVVADDASTGLAPEKTALPLEMVIVTARRIEQTANDVGMDVQAFTGERLERLRINSVESLTAVVPSFSLARSYQGVPTYTLRGIGFNTINMSATSTVGTYMDEVAYPYPILNSGPVFDLQRVEVLKGPQGTLFGRNTTAGLINLVTHKPTDSVEGLARLELGNFGTGNVEGMLSGPLTERLAARLALRSENSSDGWQRSQNGQGEVGKVDNLGVRAALAWTPDERLRVDFSYNGWRNESDTLASQGIGLSDATAGSPFNAPGLADYLANNQPDANDQADWAPRAVRSADIGTGLGLGGDLAQDSQLHAFKLHVDYALGDALRMVALTGYHDMTREALVDFGGVPNEILLQKLEGDIESFSQELRLEGETDAASWVLGAYYAEDELLDSNRTLLGDNANVGLIRTFTVPLLGSPFNSGGYTPVEASQAFRTFRDEAHIDVQSWSVFGSSTFALNETLALTAGLRYTEDSQDYSGCSRDFNGNMLPAVNVTFRSLFATSYGTLADEIGEGDCTTFDPEQGQFGLVESELNEDNLAWRLGLEWSAGADSLVYASVSQGAKSGTTPVNAANIATQNAPVGQEKLLAYEIGVKSTLLDQRMQLNASAFYYDYEDKQLSVYFADPIFTVLGRLANVPESEAYGLDTEVSLRVTTHLTAVAAATLLHTEVLEYEGIDSSGQPSNASGAEFLYSPDVTATLTLLYDRPLTDALGIGFNLNSRYQSNSEGDLEANELARIDAYTLLNAGVSLYCLDRSWELALWGSNLTDEYYWVSTTQNANTWVRLPGKARSYGASLTYRF